MSAQPKMTDENLHEQMQDLGRNARLAARELANASNSVKDIALVQAAISIRQRKNKILEANQKDIAYGKEQGLTEAQIDRLTLNDARIEAMAAGIETIATSPDPVNKIRAEWDRPNGLVIQRVSVPLGVIGVIYEARPNVTADAAALCIKSGNAVILRCGSECLHSSEAIVRCMQEGLHTATLPIECVQLVPTRSREAVGKMLTMTDWIDIIIPRGGKSLTQRVKEESRIPTILHLDGNCHTYIHEQAEAGMAVELVRNAKMRRVGICGATESVLVDRAIAKSIIPKLVDTLSAEQCELRGDEECCKIDARIKPASEEDWGTEYLAPILSIKCVGDVNEAITHINHYGSHHTDAIVTADIPTARVFLRKVDSAIVIHNSSTQFADGGEFGFGAEIGISTGRLHARGPVGAEQLTTYKYVVHGSGQTRP